jgi:hypothetical protein
VAEIATPIADVPPLDALPSALASPLLLAFSLLFLDLRPSFLAPVRIDSVCIGARALLIVNTTRD